MYLSSFSIIEPEDDFYFYQPGWLNAWEAHLYQKSLKSTQANGWGLKRFGTQSALYAAEMIRNPLYQHYLDAMEQAADDALQALSAKERVKLLKSRTAFIYVDSWGESGTFENISSALHISAIDTLPKNLVKKFAVHGPTCKIRGEKQALTQAMALAKDYLSWDVFDYVVICAAYRAIPMLVFSDEDLRIRWGDRLRGQADKVNLTVERTGCFIFSQQKSAIKVSGGQYSPAQRVQDAAEADRIAFAGLRKDLLKRSAIPQHKILDLAETYGASGCMTPALSFAWIDQHADPATNIRTIVPDTHSGFSYFDIESCRE
ncbi:ATP-binding protein [Pantoea vagans]|uniref:ATP-binding protein n=1 Tax=Pantoea vagans TaxID=470934 RepID=UPI001093D536|nr:ATP-binding protein [Pantoea vagans]QCA05732.1 ATP-binding protein [Pantoea vagans]